MGPLGGFVHLNVRTHYSLLEGALRIPDLVAGARDMGMPAVAQTDLGNMFGAIDFYSRCRGAGVRPILGAEVFVAEGGRRGRPAPDRSRAPAPGQDPEEAALGIRRLVLLCRDREGFGNLCRLLSLAWHEGLHHRPRIDLGLLGRHGAGLVCVSPGAPGPVGRLLHEGRDGEAREAALALRSVFGGDLYLGLRDTGLPGERELNRRTAELGEEVGAGLVAANPCAYLSREDAGALEVLRCIQTGGTRDAFRGGGGRGGELWLRPPGEMRRLFGEWPGACDATLEVAEKCRLELVWKDPAGRQIYHLPDFPIEGGEGEEEHFGRLAREGLGARFRGPHFAEARRRDGWEGEERPRYEARMGREIGMIVEMGFAGYFLVVADFIRWSKENGIPVGPGRGSGAGSLVAYAMGITDIDPIPYNLLFERFINPERVSMPDFDVDFCQNGRGRVIDYVTRKYGEDRVGQIITFGKLQARAVVKDVSRVFGLPFQEADAVSKLIPEEPGMTLDKAFEREPRLRELAERDPRLRQVFAEGRKLEGLCRHAGIHAAGVVITKRPLVEHCPLFRGAKGEKVIQFDKDFAERIGLIKFDFLGLKTLTAIDHASRIIRRDGEPGFDIGSVPLDDRGAFGLIGAGNTAGVFQFESSGMVDLCRRIGPDSIDDLTAINALYRPGPMGSGMHDEFVEVKRGRRPETYLFEELRPILKDTYGIIVYQEQVMHIAQRVAGYTLGQADALRKAMGKKDAGEMRRHRGIFLKGARAKGFDPGRAGELYDLMAKFGEYGFNKSHAVAYSYISYQTAFLKRRHPPAFFAAVLSAEMSNTDKTTAYIKDARENGVEMLPPDVNESLAAFDVEGRAVRFGLAAVKNVGEGAAERIVGERRRGGAYRGVVDFCGRLPQKVLGKKLLESLARAGAFDGCERRLNRRTVAENAERFVGHGLARQQERSLGQASLFDLEGVSPGEEWEGPGVEPLPEYGDRERFDLEESLMGAYVSGHPLDGLAGAIRRIAPLAPGDVRALDGDGRRDCVLAGLVRGRKDVTTRKGERMCFVALEGLGGSSIECVVFPGTLVRHEALLAAGGLVVMRGRVDLSESPRKMFPDSVRSFEDELEERVTGVRIGVTMEGGGEARLEGLREGLARCAGKAPLELVLRHGDGEARLPLGGGFRVSPSAVLAAREREGFHDVEFVIDGAAG